MNAAERQVVTPPHGEPRPGPGPLAMLWQQFPGVVLAATCGAVATVLAGWIGVDLLGYARSPISAIPLAVLLGLLVRDLVGVSPMFEPGLRLCVKRLLRVGIVLLGIRLSLVEAGVTGLIALPLVVVCIATAFVIVRSLTRMLDLPERLGTLIAVGTSICGVTAIVATGPVIDASEDETSYAVATIALFGTIALFAYPFLAHLLFTDARHVGFFLGTAIHDTSQVAGAGLTYQQQFGAPLALDVALVTKLVRNCCMVAVIPLARLLHRSPGGGESRAHGIQRLTNVVPLFVLGFLALAAVRTIGDMSPDAFGVIPPALWARMIGIVQQIAELALLLAMAAVGLSTSFRRLRVLGLRPLAVGMAAALCVGIVSVTLIRVVAAMLGS